MNRRLKQHVNREKTTPGSLHLDSSFLDENPYLRRSAYSLLPGLSSKRIKSLTTPRQLLSEQTPPSSVPMHSTEHEDPPHSQQALNTFASLKNELKSILQIYLSSKEQEQPIHWFFRMLHLIKNCFGYLSNFIYVRLLDTKINVARKVLGALESNTEPHSKLTLSSLEKEMLSNGALGNCTYYFRTHTFWSEFSQDESCNGGVNGDLCLLPSSS